MPGVRVAASFWFVLLLLCFWAFVVGILAVLFRCFCRIGTFWATKVCDGVSRNSAGLAPITMEKPR